MVPPYGLNGNPRMLHVQDDGQLSRADLRQRIEASPFDGEIVIVLKSSLE